MTTNAKKVAHTVRVASHIGQSCECCSEAIGGGFGDDGDITPGINHYIAAHGYELLHVGTETSDTDDGKLWHNTVAILGSSKKPKKKELPSIDELLDGRSGVGKKPSKRK